LRVAGDERLEKLPSEMADRAAAGNAVDLPMSRQDIADYPGLTIGTDSRTVTVLETGRRDRPSELAVDRIAQSRRAE
jgi:hypothetical protein